jgi:hypothetical protein
MLPFFCPHSGLRPLFWSEAAKKSWLAKCERVFVVNGHSYSIKVRHGLSIYSAGAS